MALQALLIAAQDEGCRGWLQQCLGEAVVLLPADARTPEECVAEITDTPDVALLFVCFDKAGKSAQSALVERAATRHPGLPIVAVGRDDDSEIVLAAMRSGAQDFLVVGRDEARLGSVLDRVLERKRGEHHRADAAMRGAGQVVSLVSAPQSPWLAFVGGHIAFVLQAIAQRDQRVLLLDLSLPGGNAPILFDGAQDYTALDILRDVDRCDETLVESAFQRLHSGVYLLALPEDFSSEQLADQPIDLERLIAIFRDLFDFVVLCGDRGLGMRPVEQMIAHSDHALLLSDQSVLHSRQNKAMLQALRQRAGQRANPGPALELVVVNYQADIGMRSERLAQLLEVPLADRIGGRAAVRIKAMNAGESMLEHAPGDAFTRDVTRLTERLLGIEAAAPRARRGLVGLLRGGRSR
jgi:pilus assembly protein CpaE